MRTTLSLRASILLIIFITVLEAGTKDAGDSDWATRRRELLQRNGRTVPKPIILKPESHEVKIRREEAERKSSRRKPKKSKKPPTHKPLQINPESEESFNSYRNVQENMPQEFLTTTLSPKRTQHNTKNRRKLPKPVVLSTSNKVPTKTKEFPEESKGSEENRPFQWHQSDIQRKVEEKAVAERKSIEKSRVQASEKSEIHSKFEEQSTNQRKSKMKSVLKQKSEEKSKAITSKLEKSSHPQGKSRRRPPIQLGSEEKLELVQSGRSLTRYEESFGKMDDNNGDTVRRKKAAADAAPELGRDEIAADPVAEKDNMTGLGYPEEVIPGLTCLTEDTVKKQLKLMSVHYGKPKCPRKLPCRKFTSCLYFKSGLLTKSFGINMQVAKDYYNEVFRDLHKEKKKEIITNFEECIAYYSLEEPFDTSKAAETTPMPEISHTHKPKAKRQIMEGESTTNIALLGSAENLDEKPKPSTDCFTRIQDFLECKEIVELKGTCYWPHKEKA